MKDMGEQHTMPHKTKMTGACGVPPGKPKNIVSSETASSSMAYLIRSLRPMPQVSTLTQDSQPPQPLRPGSDPIPQEKIASARYSTKAPTPICASPMPQTAEQTSKHPLT